MKKFLTDNLHIIVIVVAVIAVCALVKVRRIENGNTTKTETKDYTKAQPCVETDDDED